jgi:predicted  nucleic acid-binding Zn-ribbon protein
MVTQKITDHAKKALEGNMRIDVHVHTADFDELRKMFFSLNHKVDRIMASNAELQQSLTDLGNQLDKAKGEIVQKISDLEAAVAAGGGSTPEVDAALEALKGKVQALDDLHADV